MVQAFEAFVMQMRFPICSKINMLMFRAKARLSLKASRDLYAQNVFFINTSCLFCFILYLLLVVCTQVSVFTSFATSGNPNTNLIGADMESVTWKPVESNELPFKCLNFDEHLSFINLPESERLALWNELYEETNTRLY